MWLFLLLMLLHMILINCFQHQLIHGEYGSSCHWEFTQWKINCPIKKDQFSECVGVSIELDTPRAQRFLCGKTGVLYISWDIIPADQSQILKDYYIVLGSKGDFCSDPMREFANVYSPTRKYVDYWRIFKNESPYVCISGEHTDKGNRCFLNEGRISIEYGYGPGCILIYCDNLWDPCYLNLDMTIDPKIWIQSSEQNIRIYTKTITINGGGWDTVDITKNIISCYDGKNETINCICSDVSDGYLTINFDQPLSSKNEGYIKISIEVVGKKVPKSPITIIGRLDLSQSKKWRHIAELEFVFIVAGIGIAISAYFVYVWYRNMNKVV